MSTFIYTLQRKVQELQNFKNYLIRENKELKSTLSILTEADTGGGDGGNGSGGRLPEVRGAEQIAQMYQGAGGIGAYNVRAVDNPMHYYTGFQITNVPFTMPTNWITVNYNGGTLLMPYAYTNSQGGWQVPSLTPNMVGQIVAINLLHNPQFSFNNFENANQIYQAFKTALYNLPGGPYGSTAITNQFLAIAGSSGFRQWMNSGWNSTAQRDSTGVWNMSTNWPY